MVRVAAVVVTHNSEDVIDACVAALKGQTRPPESIYLIDSGSSATAYVEKIADKQGVALFREENVGFARANNIGINQCPDDTDYIAFVNPDAFLREDTFEKAVNFCADQPETGCLTGKLLRFDLEHNSVTNVLDSTGVFRAWYGRWLDRGHGKRDWGQYDKEEFVPAACGAFMFCRMTAVREVIAGSGYLFDPDFFLYKEDIEMCLRLRKHGWKIVYQPDIVVYHCRGWQPERSSVAYAARLMSARNEIILYQKHPSGYILWALLKYALVRFGRI